MEASKYKHNIRWLTRIRRITRDQYRMKLLEQKLMGVGMLIISAIILWMCWDGNEDCGAVFITAPLGLMLLFSREICIV